MKLLVVLAALVAVAAGRYTQPDFQSLLAPQVLEYLSRNPQVLELISNRFPNHRFPKPSSAAGGVSTQAYGNSQASGAPENAFQTSTAPSQGSNEFSIQVEPTEGPAVRNFWDSIKDFVGKPFHHNKKTTTAPSVGESTTGAETSAAPTSSTSAPETKQYVYKPEEQAELHLL